MSYTYEYPRPSVTTDIVVMTMDHPKYILLIKRANEPFKDYWALPGGFMEMGETLAESAARELFEETNLEIPGGHKFLEMFHIADGVNRDPRGRTISACFFVGIPKICDVRAGDDAKELKWFKLRSILNKEVNLAFDHYEIIDGAFHKYINILFEL